MAEAVFADTVKAVEKFLEEKQSVVAREKELVEQLDSALQRMGYRIVSMSGAGTMKRRGRPSKSPQAVAVGSITPMKRRGRPPGSKNKAATKTGRRGRPRKAKS